MSVAGSVRGFFAGGNTVVGAGSLALRKHPLLEFARDVSIAALSDRNGTIPRGRSIPADAGHFEAGKPFYLVFQVLAGLPVCRIVKRDDDRVAIASHPCIFHAGATHIASGSAKPVTFVPSVALREGTVRIGCHVADEGCGITPVIGSIPMHVAPVEGSGLLSSIPDFIGIGRIAFLKVDISDSVAIFVVETCDAERGGEEIIREHAPLEEVGGVASPGGTTTGGDPRVILPKLLTLNVFQPTTPAKKEENCLSEVTWRPMTGRLLMTFGAEPPEPP